MGSEWIEYDSAGYPHKRPAPLGNCDSQQSDQPHVKSPDCLNWREQPQGEATRPTLASALRECMGDAAYEKSRDQAKAALCVPKQTEGGEKPRCAVCGWPMTGQDGHCRPGDCSVRPLPQLAFDPVRANNEYRSYWGGAQFNPWPEPSSPPATAGTRQVVYLECPKCAYNFRGWAKHSGLCPNDGEQLVSVTAGTAREFYKQKYGYEPQRHQTFSVEAALQFADEHADHRVRIEEFKRIKAEAEVEKLRQERDALKGELTQLKSWVIETERFTPEEVKFLREQSRQLESEREDRKRAEKALREITLCVIDGEMGTCRICECPEDNHSDDCPVPEAMASLKSSEGAK